MRAAYLVPLILGLTLAGPAHAESLKIATWNIENLRPGSRTPEELEKLRALVDLLDADVVALQEVDGPEAAAEVFDPSDHCPIAVVFDTGDGEPGVTGDVVDRLLRRLDAMQRELDAVRVEVEGLRE